jgi:hypothetical protein
MNKLPKIGLLLILSLLTISSYAQVNFIPGYIISAGNEKINGFIDYRSWEKNPDYVEFRTGIDDNIQRFSPLDIIEFGVDSDVYISAIVETEVSPEDVSKLNFNPNLEIEIDTVFLQTIFNGNKELYYYMSLEGNTNFYIRQGNEISLLSYKEYFKETDDTYKSLVENNRYIGQLSLYLNDCPEVQSRLRTIEYTKRSLENLFAYYYKCTGSDPAYEMGEAKAIKEFGLLAGATLSSTKFVTNIYDYLSEADVDNSINFSGGIFFNVIMPRNLYKVSINNELFFSSYNIVTSYDEERFNHVLTTAWFDYTYLKINSMVRYKYPIGTASLFFNGGISFGYSIKGTNHKEANYYNANRIEESLAVEDARKSERAILAGAGVKYNRFSFETRLEIGDGIVSTATLRNYTTRIHFLIGFKF